MYRRRALSALAGCGLAALAFGCDAAGSGVVLLYHHVDDETPASTSVTRQEFAEQLDYLEREAFSVMPLLDLLRMLEAGTEVPERSVAITFDDAYRSILTGALPELRSRGMPFTVFVNTEGVDEGFGAYLDWDELRSLGAAGGTIGNHSVSHGHLVRKLEGESEADWRRRVRDEIVEAGSRLETEVGDLLVPVFAYPYGEYTAPIKSIVAELGLFALGQQSGAIGPGSDFLALPRYPIATGLGLSASDFALRVRSRPLPVSLIGPEEHIVGSNLRPPLRLALDNRDDLQLGALACYASGQGGMTVAWRDPAMNAFTATPERALGSGRSKYNCTVPSKSEPGVYYWYAYLWMRRREDGRWYDE